MLDLSHSFVECNQVRQKSYCIYHCASGRNDSHCRGIQQKRTPDNPDQCCDPESRTEYLRSMHDGCRMQLGQAGKAEVRGCPWSEKVCPAG